MPSKYLNTYHNLLYISNNEVNVSTIENKSWDPYYNHWPGTMSWCYCGRQLCIFCLLTSTKPFVLKHRNKLSDYTMVLFCKTETTPKQQKQHIVKLKQVVTFSKYVS